MRAGPLITIIVLILIVIFGIWYFVTAPNTAVVPNTGGTGTQTQTQTQTTGSITFPAGGETLKAGQTYVLLWSDGVGQTAPTQIFLVNTALESQGESVAITDRVYNVPDLGSYHYTVPTTTPAGTYKFEIGTLMSNPFTIASSTAR